MPTIKDGQGNEWTVAEVQHLVNQVGSLTKAARRLSMRGTAKIRELGVKTAAEWVQEKAQADPQWLKDYVIRCDGRKKAAEQLSISVTHLNTVLTSIGVDLKAPVPSREEAHAVMTKFGSPIFAARVLGTTPNEIKKALGEEWRELKDPTKAGSHSVRTGSIAEDHYKSVRGEAVVESPAEKSYNHRGFDHMDSEHGRVNVKAAIVRKGRASWSAVVDLNWVDSIAFIPLTNKRVPEGSYYVLNLTKWQPTPHSPVVKVRVSFYAKTQEFRVHGVGLA